MGFDICGIACVLLCAECAGGRPVQIGVQIAFAGGYQTKVTGDVFQVPCC